MFSGIGNGFYVLMRERMTMMKDDCLVKDIWIQQGVFVGQDLGTAEEMR